MTDVRLDKWLWAARFFKTRALAAEAVAGGKVHLNGVRVKPARATRVGDELQIRRGGFETTVVVLGTSELRRPAREAALLYEETEESRQARAALVAELRAEAASRPQHLGRPSKKARRESIRLARGERD